MCFKTLLVFQNHEFYMAEPPEIVIHHQTFNTHTAVWMLWSQHWYFWKSRISNTTSSSSSSSTMCSSGISSSYHTTGHVISLWAAVVLMSSRWQHVSSVVSLSCLNWLQLIGPALIQTLFIPLTETMMAATSGPPVADWTDHIWRMFFFSHCQWWTYNRLLCHHIDNTNQRKIINKWTERVEWKTVIIRCWCSLFLNVTKLKTVGWHHRVCLWMQLGCVSLVCTLNYRWNNLWGFASFLWHWTEYQRKQDNALAPLSVFCDWLLIGCSN